MGGAGMSTPLSTAGTADAPIVFLHIPKTAGQTIHSELERLVGQAAISPVRVHTQVPSSAAQMPPGYGLYSGHLDWEKLDDLPTPRFTFTVVRDPLERIASFYFYLRREALKMSRQELNSPQRTGMRLALQRTADDYFFAGDASWKTFINDHYNNVYCTYFATRKIRGWQYIKHLDGGSLLRLAMAGVQSIDKVYSTEDLSLLETDIAACTGQRINISQRYLNAGPDADTGPRWPKLRACFEQDKNLAKIRNFVRVDQRLLDALNATGRERFERQHKVSQSC